MHTHTHTRKHGLPHTQRNTHHEWAEGQEAGPKEDSGGREAESTPGSVPSHGLGTEETHIPTPGCWSPFPSRDHVSAGVKSAVNGLAPHKFHTEFKIHPCRASSS